MSVEAVHTARLTAGVDLRKTDCHPDFWYPIAWSGEVKPGAMISRVYAGEPVVVVRGKDGKLFALENRLPVDSGWASYSTNR